MKDQNQILTTKNLIVFLKPILLIILTSFLYITLVKPARLIVNNKIYYPLISAIFSNYKVNLPSDNSVAVIINKKNVNNDVLFIPPFNGLYILPAVLLALRRNWFLVKKLTYYHLFLTLIPLLFLNKFIIYPSGLFINLILLLGLVFTFRAFKDYSTDHH